MSSLQSICCAIKPACKMAELPPKPAGLVIGKERARGSYGAVYSGELDGKPVVVKRIHLVLLRAANNDKLMRDFYRECRILSTVRHANVVRFIGAFWDEETKEPLLVMEAAKENLREYLERNKDQITMKKQVAICSSMAEGLSFLHARAEPIVHRDLKPENVLVWEDGTIKIADFGQSKLLDHPQNYMRTTQPGTVAYMPPEALKRNPQYTSKVDVFSLGTVMLEVGTQSPSSVWLEGIGVVPEVERHKDDLALLPDTHPLKPLIVWCLQDNHESRPDVQSTLDQVKLLAGGLKEPVYQQRIGQWDCELQRRMEREEGLQRRLEEETRGLRDSKGREEGLQRRLEEVTRMLWDTKGREEGLQQRLEVATQELVDTKGREEGLQRRLEESTQELRVSRKRHQEMVQKLDASTTQLEDVQEQLRVANHKLNAWRTEFTKSLGTLNTTCDELEDVQKQLETATSDLNDTRKEPEEASKWGHTHHFGGPPGTPPTQQSPPQVQASVTLHPYKVSRDAVRAISFYDKGRLQTVGGTKGLLVTSIEVNKATLDCSVQPLDLIIHLDGTRVEFLCDHFGQCTSLSSKMMKSTADVWVARTPGIPSLYFLPNIQDMPTHQSGRKHRIVGFLATQKDLVDPASYLGVRMDKYSNGKKVEYVTVTRIGEKAGLRYNDIIWSVTVITGEGVVGPETEWTFESIKKHARESPSVCALLLNVVNY